MENKPTPYLVRELSPSATLADAIALHWPEYLFEGLELGAFMLAACAFGTLLFYSESPVVLSVPSAAVRLVLMGAAMGGTAIAIILSPMGRRSGAHFNPVVSFTFFCLGKMHWLDAFFYIVFQFAGGAFGVLVARILIGPQLASPSPWWDSWWFKTLLAAMSVMMVFAVYHYRMGQVRQRFDLRLEERLGERTRIAREFHDTLLQTIQGSKLVADTALDSCTDSQMHGMLQRLSDWLDRASREGRRVF